MKTPYALENAQGKQKSAQQTSRYNLTYYKRQKMHSDRGLSYYKALFSKKSESLLGSKHAVRRWQIGFLVQFMVVLFFFRQHVPYRYQ